jgi:hypothetical protein
VFGAALAATSTVFAFYFWMRRTEIQPTTTEKISAEAAAFA